MLGPNITGTYGTRAYIRYPNSIYEPHDSGALYYRTDSTYQVANVSSTEGYDLGLTCLDASRSVATYVDSGKVYPLSLALNFIIKA